MTPAPVVIRPIGPADGEALRRLHASLSADTVYHRFFSARGPLTEAEVAYFTSVDQHARVALGAFVDDVLIGVARYDRTEACDDAEVAFVVTDTWQGHGVGSALLAELVRRARADGVRRFIADTMESNRRMVRLLAELGTITTLDVDHGFVHIAVDVPAPPARHYSTQLCAIR